MGERYSIIKAMGIPESFAGLLLTFSFILLLAPYLSGGDFGLFKIPQFSENSKKKLRVIGPIIFISCALLFVPIFHLGTEGRPTPNEGQPSTRDLVVPQPFAVVLLTFSFILLLAPYLSGGDFGLFKIPQFSENGKKKLRVIGPMMFISCALLFIPIAPPGTESKPNSNEGQPASGDLVLDSETAILSVQPGPQTGLLIDFKDVYGDRIDRRFSVRLIAPDGPILNYDSHPGDKRLRVDDLRTGPDGRYQIEVGTPSYFPLKQFVSVASDGMTRMAITFLGKPEKVIEAKFPEYPALPSTAQRLLESSAKVLAFERKHGQELYLALDDTLKANLLNITAKTRVTTFGNREPLISYCVELRSIRPDRIFAAVRPELLVELENSVASSLFQVVSSSQDPPAQFADFKRAGAFETKERHGNLHLSFFVKGDQCIAEISLDAGLESASLSQAKQSSSNPRNHPFLVHEVLKFFQKLDPGYVLQFL